MDQQGQAKPKAKTVVYSEADVSHPDLFETLRKWRKQKAAEEGIDHYQVLHQKTLVEIAIRLPDSISALKTIKGIGNRLAQTIRGRDCSNGSRLSPGAPD